jgi:hypothetical protein
MISALVTCYLSGQGEASAEALLRKAGVESDGIITEDWAR